VTVQTFEADPLNGVVAPPVFSATGTSAALEQLAQWVTAAQNAHQLVAPLVSTPFVPDSYRPKVDPRATEEQKRDAYNVAVATGTAAVLQGLSLGLDPLTSLQQIYVVHGRPGMYARIKVALVTSHGHEVWTEDLTDARAVVCGRRKGSQNVERVVITMDQAKKAGWTSNQTYTKTPQDMLYARAAGRVCDRIAPDVLMGIASVEDIADEVAADAQPARTRTVKRAEVAPAAGERPALPSEPSGDNRANPVPANVTPPQRQQSGPPLPGEEDPVEQAQPGITDPQMRKLGVLFAQLGIKGKGEREDRLTIASKVANRALSSSKELTLGEARVLIDTLESVASLPQADGDYAIDEMLGRRGPAPAAEQPAAEPVAEVEDPPGWEPMDGAEAEAEADHG
jgi:hypothetical protein